VRGEYGFKPVLPAIGGSKTVGIVDATDKGVDAAIVTSLADARIKRDNAKKLLGEVDPSVNRKEERRNARIARANTFEAVAKELMDKFEAEGDAATTLKKKRWLLDFTDNEFGERPIGEIKAPEILDALRKIEKRGRHETATRARSTVGAVFRFAIATGRAERDPTADLRGALITPNVTHRATIVEPKAVGALLRAIDGFEGHAVTRYALRLAPPRSANRRNTAGFRRILCPIRRRSWNVLAERKGFELSVRFTAA
jgi:hypothetical protein